MRVGVIKDWDSRWFTSKQAFGDTLVEDYKIRKTLKKQRYAAGVPKICLLYTSAKRTGARVSGPIPLPTDKEVVTILRLSLIHI